MSKQKSPLSKGLREGSYLLLAAIIVAAGFNLFASTNIPWIRELPTLEEADDSLLFGDLPSSETPNETTSTDNSASIAPVDTAVKTDAAAETVQPTDTMPKTDAEPASADPKPTTAKPSTTEPGSSEAQATDGPRGISTPKAKQIFDAKSAIFIDARRADQFAEGHIPGAMNVYAYDFPAHIPDLIPLPKDKLVVVYCDGGLCELSHELAEELMTFGFKRVVVYLGGVNEWTESNYPMTGGN